MLSILFACAIALNLQLVVVFKRQPSAAMQKYFIGVPVALSLMMSEYFLRGTFDVYGSLLILPWPHLALPPLFLGWFGFDDSYQYCWYSSDGVSRHTMMMRVLLTYNLW